jgi:hypothetical protein
MAQAANASKKPATADKPKTTKVDYALKPKTTKVDYALPAGFTNQSNDVVGFYDPDVEAVIQFEPREAVHADSNIDVNKVSTLIFGTLVAPCKLVESSKTGNVVDGKKGDLVGVWYKPGMKGLRDLCGVHVIMYPAGEKEVGKPNPMVEYVTASKSKGTRLPITEDRRDKSKQVATIFDTAPNTPAPF